MAHVVQRGPDVVAITWDADDRDEEAANARLIAAAPRMLEALRRIESGCSFPEDDVQRAIRDVAREAIAAATEAKP